MADAKQGAFVGNQVVLQKGTPAPPPAGSVAIITTDGTTPLLQQSDGSTSSIGGGGGLSPIANNTALANTSGSSAVPVATDAATLRTMLSVQASSAVAITGGSIAGTTITLPPAAFSDGPLSVTGSTGVLNNPTLTGLTATATTLTNDFSTGKSGGLTVYGDTASGGNLTLRPNAADATTGHVIVGNAQFRVNANTGYIRIGSAATPAAPLEIAQPGGGGTTIDFQAATGIQYINRTGTTTQGLGFTTAGNASNIVFYPGNTTKALELTIASSVVKVGFFAKAPAGQQTGGAATASGTYTATEQGMLQKAYDCLRTFGLLS